MKKVFKITIILIILMIGFSQTTITYCVPRTVVPETDTGTGGQQKISIDNPKSWDPTSSPDADATTLNNKVRPILGIIQAVGIVVSVVALMVIGIKEITASVEEKSIIKQAMPGYILGVILVATMTTLPSIIYDFMTK